MTAPFRHIGTNESFVMGCCAVNCANQSSKYRLFRFPRDPERRRRWAIACRRDKWYPNNNTRLCEVHFQSGCFEQNRADGRKLLRPDAVPTIFNFPNCPRTARTLPVKIYNMPLLCAVYGCNRRCGNVWEDDGKTPLNFFAFPAFGTSVFKQWVHACGRGDLERNDHTYRRVVCSRHFSSCEITGNRFLRARLIKDAVPTQNLPHELSHSAHLHRTISTDIESQHRLATVVKHEDINDSFEISEVSSVGTDSVHPVSDIGDSVHPILDIGDSVAHWFCSGKDGETTWYFQTKVLNEGPPQVTRSVRITEGCPVPEFFIGSVPLKKIQAHCILVNRNINNREEFIAILIDFCEITVATHLLQSAIDILEAAMIAYECEESVDASCMLMFIREQLKMSLKPPTVRCWNPAVLRWATLLHFHYPAAYRFLSTSGFLLVPCDTTLAKYTCSDIAVPGINDDLEK